MSDPSATVRHGFPFIAPQQQAKQYSYNTAMAALDQLVQLAVKSRTTAAPPGSPADGDAYIVAPGGTGAWSGKDGKHAVWLNGAWSFRTAADGWIGYIEDTDSFVARQSGAWVPLSSAAGDSMAKLGINATADLTTRLAVGADASLFTHAGSSHRLKLDKATAGDTASIIFETNASARAEFGLTGDDALHLKVSPNGSTWYQALTVAQGSGLVGLPIGQLQFPATQNPASDVNTLDDYEEGTWTPTLQFGTSSTGITYNATTTGRYTKIGRMVTCDCQLALTSKGSATGSGQILGLPFSALSQATPAVSIGYSAGMAGITGYLTGLVVTNKLNLYQIVGTTTSGLTNANFGNTSTLYMSFTYPTA